MATGKAGTRRGRRGAGPGGHSEGGSSAYSFGYLDFRQSDFRPER